MQSVCNTDYSKVLQRLDADKVDVCHSSKRSKAQPAHDVQLIQRIAQLPPKYTPLAKPRDGLRRNLRCTCKITAG